jgi:hypothetical protein
MFSLYPPNRGRGCNKNRSQKRKIDFGRGNDVGYLLDVFNGDYTPSFVMAACVAVVGACSYAFIVGRAEPLPLLPSSRA